MILRLLFYHSGDVMITIVPSLNVQMMIVITTAIPYRVVVLNICLKADGNVDIVILAVWMARIMLFVFSWKM